MTAPPEVLDTTAGSILDPLVYTFREYDSGAVIDLTGYNAEVTWLRHSTGESGSFAAAATGNTEGWVRFSVPAALTATPDTIDLVVWAGNASDVRLDGDRWRIEVAERPGPAPTV